MNIRTETARGILTIEIARAEKKNALTLQMFEAMAAATAAALQDPGVRALLIIGQPGIFSSGGDLEDFMQRPARGQASPHLHGFPLSWSSTIFPFFRQLIFGDKPVVAAVDGPAVGLGAVILLHCDLVYVSENARLQMPFTAYGQVPQFGASLLVPQLLGQAKAAEMLLLGDALGADEVVACGIAAGLLPAVEVVGHARRVARRFNALPPGALRATKRLMRKRRAALVPQVLRDEAAAFADRLRSPEANEAVAAFFEKREPDFSRF